MKVIVTGILGQDGANMVEYLLKNTDSKIYGMIRRTSNPNFINCQSFIKNERFQLVYGDLSDSISIDNLVRDIQPNYFINFAAQSFVGCSWEIPLQTFDVNATGVARCLEAIRRFQPKCRFYSAGSSEEFGDVQYSPQDIIHPVRPRSPYGASKAAARHLVKVYRESYNLFAVHGILFNHEGIKRGEEFVTRKITKGVARIIHSIRNKKPFAPIELGNLDAKRDWSDSEDFVDGVWKMVNQEKPKDYVLSSNETHTIREFINKAFSVINIDGVWHGQGTNEELSLPNYMMEEHDIYSSVLVKINPKFYRPAEVELLLGDSNPAREELGWKPKISFDNLVERMVKYDIDNFKI
ncbi:GDP-mannose 4,6-dehydratase [archaeon]|nr:GDP-mannose 4,6-dehydratase [archaeon]NDB54501.1 GDP-mannose 4,6-dehydratase [archaeon]